MSKILQPMQASIEGLHDVSTEADVRAFIIDAETWKVLPGARAGMLEQLIVFQQQEDDVELALYIDPGVMADLEQNDPLEKLHLGNLENYCVALEGVSHFVYLIWRGMEGDSVSALELELQAEVDKFVLALTLLVEQGAPIQSTGRLLLKQFFESYRLCDGLAADEADRYHVASRAAHGYCRSLLTRYGSRAEINGMRRDVRKYYRQGLSEKLRAA